MPEKKNPNPFRQFSYAVSALPDSDDLELYDGDRVTERGKAYVDVDEAGKDSEGIRAAVDVALGLGRPLLVSGEPGSGKTELGYHVARKLGISQVHYIACKSSTEATDLFYTYDSLRRFRDAQLLSLRQPGAGDGVRECDAREYVTYQAFGRAVLEAHGAAIARPFIENSIQFARDAALERPGKRVFPINPRRSVVIIDEIDKAARDVCNDVLHEIEQMTFNAPEIQQADAQLPELIAGRRPIVVITSNSETQLPDAFLRRCVYLHLEFPKGNRLKSILDRRRAADQKKGRPELPREDEARLLRFFHAFRGLNPEKKPGLSELLEASRALAEGERPTDHIERFAPLRGILVKLQVDLGPFQRLLQQGVWIEPPQQAAR